MKAFKPSIKDLVTEGDIVQINPNVDGFGGCYLTVTKPKTGSPYCTGYVNQPGRPDVPLFTRVKWGDIEFAGRATWMHEEHLSQGLKEVAETMKRREAKAAAAPDQKVARKTASRK